MKHSIVETGEFEAVDKDALSPRAGRHSYLVKRQPDRREAPTALTTSTACVEQEMAHIGF